MSEEDSTAVGRNAAFSALGYITLGVARVRNAVTAWVDARLDRFARAIVSHIWAHAANDVDRAYKGAEQFLRWLGWAE